MDAFPGYTMFDKTKKVLCVLQIVNDREMSEAEGKSVMLHKDDEKFPGGKKKIPVMDGENQKEEDGELVWEEVDTDFDSIDNYAKD